MAKPHTVRLTRGFITTDRPPWHYMARQVVVVTPHKLPGWWWHRTRRGSWIELGPDEWENL